MSFIPHFSKKHRREKLQAWRQHVVFQGPDVLATPLDRRYYVYVLKMKTKKHLYVGSTGMLALRLQRHYQGLACWSTHIYGFDHRRASVLRLIVCSTREAAYTREHQESARLRRLFPDIPVCSDGYSFGTFNTDQYD